MKENITIKLRTVAVALMFTFIYTPPAIWHDARFVSDFSIPQSSYAAEAQSERSPYGSSESGPYGEKKKVTTVDEAEKVFKEYFAKKNVKIGEIKEKELYFEAEIRDKNDAVVDKVIVDKRTGRIRSIY